MTRAVEADLAPLSTLSLRPVAEWRSVWAVHHNVLLEGPEAATDAVLRVLKARLPQPVTWKRREAPLELPTSGGGAFILQNVGGLGAEEQRRLLKWLDEPHRHTQIVSTTAHPLFFLIARGLFNASLYYRLNVMLLHVDERSTRTARLGMQKTEDVRSESGRRSFPHLTDL